MRVRPLRIAISDALIQTEAQIVFGLGYKSKGVVMRKGRGIITFQLVQIL